MCGPRPSVTRWKRASSPRRGGGLCAAAGRADAVVLGLYPHALVDWLRNNQKHLKPGALLTDVCGVKSGVVEEIQGFLRPDAEFIASHPMAARK